MSRVCTPFYRPAQYQWAMAYDTLLAGSFFFEL